MGKTSLLPDFDLVTDRNNLRKLLRWAVYDIPTVGMDKQNFRIDVELCGSTCVFSRCEAKTTAYRNGSEGFGKNYEEAATTRVGKVPTSGHHRCTSMVSTLLLGVNKRRPHFQMFGSIRILLRFEVDGCTSSSNENSSDDIDGPTSSLSSSKRQHDSFKTVYGLNVMKTPDVHLVPQSSILEIKTRAQDKRIRWGEVLPQLMISQTPFLYLAKHLQGRFGEVQIFDVANSPEVQVHEQTTQRGMRRLQLVLRELTCHMRTTGEGDWDGIDMQARDSGTT
jgi:hypothetical protein